MFHDVPDIPVPCRSGAGWQPLHLQAGNVPQLEWCSWWLGREGHWGCQDLPRSGGLRDSQRRLEGRGQWGELRGLHWNSNIHEFPRVGMAEASFCLQDCNRKEGWRAEVSDVTFGWNLGTRRSSWGSEGPSAHLGPHQRHQCPVSPVQLPCSSEQLLYPADFLSTKA